MQSTDDVDDARNFDDVTDFDLTIMFPAGIVSPGVFGRQDEENLRRLMSFHREVYRGAQAQTHVKCHKPS